jgi:hypothetical protein
MISVGTRLSDKDVLLHMERGEFYLSTLASVRYLMNVHLWNLLMEYRVCLWSWRRFASIDPLRRCFIFLDSVLLDLYPAVGGIRNRAFAHPKTENGRAKDAGSKTPEVADPISILQASRFNRHPSLTPKPLTRIQLSTRRQRFA